MDIIYIKQMGNKCLSIGNESHLSKAFYRREKINLNSFLSMNTFYAEKSLSFLM